MFECNVSPSQLRNDNSKIVLTSWPPKPTFLPPIAMPTGKRTTLYSSAAKKLYAVRDKSGKFKDIQTYKRSHRADMSKVSNSEMKEMKSKQAVNAVRALRAKRSAKAKKSRG